MGVHVMGEGLIPWIYPPPPPPPFTVGEWQVEGGGSFCEKLHLHCRKKAKKKKKKKKKVVSSDQPTVPSFKAGVIAPIRACQPSIHVF